MFNTIEFLKSFHGENKIHFRALKKDSKGINLNGTYEDVKQKLNKLNNDGYDIYFVVNSGGTHNYEINKINAVYIDFDCGKDENKKYFSLEQTQKFKDECIEKVNQFNFKSSYIIETRNGIHVYWLVETGTTEQFEQCQLQLIQYFDSDPAVTTVERIMRLPGYYWTKDINNRYMSKILAYNNIKYNIEQLINILPIVKMGDSKSKKNKTNIENKNIHNDVQSTNNMKRNINMSNHVDVIRNGLINANNYKLIQQLIDSNRLKVSMFNGVNSLGVGDIDKSKDNCLYGVPLLFDTKIDFNNHSDVYDHLKKQDLGEFLGIYEDKFCCIFHKEENPSACIFKDETTGNWWYKCYSSNCSLNKIGHKFEENSSAEINMKAKDIIAVTERLLRCNRVKALRFLRKVYNVGYVETEWQKEQKEMLDENIRTLTVNIESFKEMYPELYKRIKNVKNVLVELNIYAKEFVFTEKLTDNDDNSVFYAGMNKLIEITGTNPNCENKLAQRIGVFAFLGMMNKLSENETPETLLKSIQHFAMKNNLQSLSNVYSIPSYSDELLSYAEGMAHLFKQKNMTMKGFGREILVRTFGEDFANTMYPRTSWVQHSEKSNELTLKMHEFASEIIEKNGYVKENQLFEMLYQWYSDEIHKQNLELEEKKPFPSQESIKKQIKKSLQEMLDTYDWRRIKATNDLKKALNLTIKGAPFIIIKK